MLIYTAVYTVARSASYARKSAAKRSRPSAPAAGGRHRERPCETGLMEQRLRSFMWPIAADKTHMRTIEVSLPFPALDLRSLWSASATRAHSLNERSKIQSLELLTPC